MLSGDATNTNLFTDEEDGLMMLKSARSRRKRDEVNVPSRPGTPKSCHVKRAEKINLNETFPSPHNSRKANWRFQATTNVLLDDERHQYKIEEGFSDLERERLRIQAFCRRHRLSSQEFQQNQRADPTDKQSFTLDEQKSNKGSSEYFKWDFPSPRQSEDVKHYIHEEDKRSPRSRLCQSPSNDVSSPLRKKNGKATPDCVRSTNENARSRYDHSRSSHEHPRSSHEYPRSSYEHPESSHEHLRSSHKNAQSSQLEYVKSSPEHGKTSLEQDKSVSEYAWLLPNSKPRSAKPSLNIVTKSPPVVTKDSKPTEGRLLGRRRIKKPLLNSRHSRRTVTESNPDDLLFTESKEDSLKFDVYEFLEYQNKYCSDDSPQSAPPKESKPKRCWFF